MAFLELETLQAREENLSIPANGVELEADLSIPARALGLVLFAHGSGSGRKSSRNRFVAQALRERRLGTLLFDLLTAREERQDAVDSQLRFDIPFLASRLASVTRWALGHGRARQLPLGYFGASTGAAAALLAAAELPEHVAAVVSRGGRPDLARGALERVRAPTLLIVGGEDEIVVGLNQEAFDSMSCEKELRVVAGATHLFEEPGALEQVAELAADWFAGHLGAAFGARRVQR